MLCHSPLNGIRCHVNQHTTRLTRVQRAAHYIRSDFFAIPTATTTAAAELDQTETSTPVQVLARAKLPAPAERAAGSAGHTGR